METENDDSETKHRSTIGESGSNSMASDKNETADNSSRDHVCERNYDDVSDILSDDDSGRFTCGGCTMKLTTICRLHEHMMKEFSSGSYIYDHQLKTAYAIAESVSMGTQTEEVEDKPFGSDIDYSESASRKNKNARPKKRKIKTPVVRKSRSTRESKQTKLKISRKKPIKRSSKHDIISDDHLNEIENNDKDIDEQNLDVPVEDIYNESTDQESLQEIITSYNDTHKLNKVIDDADVEFVNDEELDEEEKSGKKKLRPSKAKIYKKSTKASNKHSEDKRKHSRELSDDDDDDNDDNVVNCDVSPKRLNRTRTKMIKLLCEHCDYSFKSEKKLNIHIVGVHGDIYPFHCVQCNRKPFKTKEEFMEHKNQHPVQIYKCELCCKELKSKEGLRLHTLAHSGVKAYMCDQCDYRGRTAAQLRQHKFNHMETKTEQCEHCGKAFFTKGKLREHIRYCRKEFNHHCSYCQKGFPTASGLRKHILMHTGERAFICDVCGFATFRTSLLKSHMRTHTGEKPYKCKFCGAKLASRGTLRLHERTHTHEKPFVCCYCNKAFTSKWNLKTHLRQHTGETPYKCDICGQGFKQNVLRKSHMRCHMETVETSGPNLHIDTMDNSGPNLQRLNEAPAIDIQHMVREPVLVENQSHRLLEPSHTPVPVVHDHYNQSETDLCGKESIQSVEHSNHLVPLDLKLHYSAGEYKNIYTSTVSAPPNTVQSNTFNLINYTN